MFWNYVFGIHNFSDNQSVLYTYHESQGCKETDEVCTYLSHYLQNILSESVTDLHLFSDARGGQNRNSTMYRMFFNLTMSKRFKTTEQYFTVRGYSFLPCDRSFAVIKRSINRHDRIYFQHSTIISFWFQEKPIPYFRFSRFKAKWFKILKNGRSLSTKKNYTKCCR